ncbi:DUF6524 family protein [Nitratifractor sp.]|uniref:DUF6524 family protein n=1 Tax=Nitratifractor sp. TaxID=2268144 RepID=UPI0025D06A88|nr:DUF6524 family protein [Nitratifractor sp.]
MLPDFLIQKARTKNGKEVRHLRWWVSLILSMALALGTWNPTGQDFVHYMIHGNPLQGFKPFYILIMLAFWIMALRAIYQSLRWYGALITAAIIIAFVYGLAQYKLVDLGDWNTLGWIGTVGMGLIIWVGLNASIIWKTMTGVYTTDVADEE